MKRIEIPGGWYGEATVDGSYAVSVNDAGRMETNVGSIPTPKGQNILYTRISPQGMKFAGQGHQDGLAWEWNGTSWVAADATFGVSPVIYDAAGRLVIANDSRFGSQGFRYVDPVTGRIYTGDETYADRERQLWEYTTLGNITIGQGEDGCHALVNGKRVMVEPGGCHFVRFQRRGNDLAIAIAKFAERKTVLLWLTGPELESFPRVGVAQPPPPVVQPPPPEKPSMPVAPNQIDMVRGVIARHPEVNTLEDGTRGKITDYVVLALGGKPWGRKDRDQNPTNNNNSDDALCYRLADGRFEIYDILSGADGSATWDYKGTFAEGENGYFREVASQTAPPIANPVPAVPTAILDAVVAKMIFEALQPLKDEIAALKARPVAGPAPAAPRTIALRSRKNGKLLCADEGDVVVANRDNAGSWETFDVEVIG